MDVGKFAVERPVATWMRIFIFMLLGAIAYNALPVELLPDVTRPSLFVVTSWAGVSPEDLESQITRQVEDAVATVQGLVRLTSSTSEGNSRVTVEFDPATDMRVAALDLLQLVQRAQRQFPSDDPTLQAPTVQKFDPNSLPVLVLGVSGVEDPVRLRTMLEDEIKPMLESAEGVGAAEVNGGMARAIMVEFDPQDLLARSMTSEDLVNSLARENQNVPGGTLREGNRQLLARSYGWLQGIKEIQAIPVGRANGHLVPLRSVARVRDSHQETTGYQRLNGQASGSFSIQKQASANTVETVANVLARLEDVKRAYPQLKFQEVYNQSRFVSNAVRSLQEAAVVGGLLAMGIVFFFLRNFRSTLVVATSIPVSVISTFSFLYFMNYSLNTMSLVGLALATGLIVDDAVVVMENIYRRMEHQGEDARTASIEGTRSITSAVISSTLTIMVVFFPLLLIPGQTGQMFRPFALVIIVAMAFSLLDALTGVPMLCSQFIRIEKPTGGFWQHQFERWERWHHKMDTTYHDWLKAAIARRRLVVAAGLGLLVLSLGLLPFIGNSFLPNSDTGTLRLRMNMPRGTALEETDKMMTRIEGILHDNKDVEAYLVSVGQGGTVGGGGGRDAGMGWVALKDSRRSTSDQVNLRLQKEFSRLPAVRASTSTMDIVRSTLSGGAQGQSFEVDLFGPDLATLAQLSNQVIDQLKGISGLGDIRNDAGDPAPEVRWIVDRDKATELGLSFSQIAGAIQTATAGKTASYYQTEGKRAPIVVQLAPENRSDVTSLLRLTVSSKVAATANTTSPGTSANAPTSVQLAQVARAETATGYATINRATRQRFTSLVSAAQGRSLNEIRKDAQAALGELKLPAGYSWDWGYRMKQESGEFGKLGFAALLAVVLIYMLLAIQFENLIVPLSIMLSVPLCIIGINLSLFWTATEFSVMAGVGCLMLVGIAVKNGILLIEYTLQKRAEGLNAEQAILAACPERLRPILITALAAMLGMVPIALRGRGGELEGPMARAVIGGLFASTVLTLFVVPCAYLILDQLETRLFRKAPKSDA